MVAGSSSSKGEKGDTLKAMAAHNTRVMPNCGYASNPYHECTEACIHKIKDTTINPPKNKKSSGSVFFRKDYRRSVTDGEIGKKMNDEKRKQSGCAKSSNPYHVCGENCNKRVSVAVVSGATYRKKPELPVLDSVPASKIGAIYLSDASSPLSSYSESGRKKLSPKSDEIVPVSGELHVSDSDVMPVNHKVQPKDGATRTKQEVDKNNASHKVVPITMDFCFSGAPNGNGDSDGDETESVVSESRVPVGRYHVKESFAPILQSIFNKYGDIGATCHLESVVMRSYYIECVCFVVQELQSASIMQFTKSKVKELLAILKDVESAQLRVAWLRGILDDIAENTEITSQQRAVEAEKAKSDSEVESLRKELESETETLAQKEREISDAKTRIEEIRERLSELEVKSSDLDKNLLSLKSKVGNLDSKSLLDELL